MTTWQKDAKEFTVSVIQNRKRRTSYSYDTEAHTADAELLIGRCPQVHQCAMAHIEVGRSNRMTLVGYARMTSERTDGRWKLYKANRAPKNSSTNNRCRMRSATVPVPGELRGTATFYTKTHHRSKKRIQTPRCILGGRSPGKVEHYRSRDEPDTKSTLRRRRFRDSLRAVYPKYICRRPLGHGC